MLGFKRYIEQTLVTKNDINSNKNANLEESLKNIRTKQNLLIEKKKK